MNTTRAPRGFTLMEAMISGAILAVLMSAAMRLIVAFNVNQQSIIRVGRTQDAARGAIDALSTDLRSAGLGATTGLVGIAPAAGATRRIPVIYSGPDVTITEPGGQKIVTNSIYIIGSEAESVGLPASGAGIQGVVSSVDVSLDPPSPTLKILCSDSAGAAADCGGGSAATNLIPKDTLPPLIVGDFRSAVFMRPNELGGAAPDGQVLKFVEGSAQAFSPDPKAPFGFPPSANIARARVVHWYLRQDSPTAPPRLFRSRPTLTSSSSTGCLVENSPFIDETNGSSSDPVGVEMGAGPIVSMQIRYVVDSNATDDPAQFTMLNSITSCDTQVMPTLREVRVQIVGLSPTMEKTTQGDKLGVAFGYKTPIFEGVQSAPATTVDPYPRRAVITRAVPRNLQGIRL